MGGSEDSHDHEIQINGLDRCAQSVAKRTMDALEEGSPIVEAVRQSLTSGCARGRDDCRDPYDFAVSADCDDQSPVARATLRIELNGSSDVPG